jgi:acyl-CoA synthetase (NDP forming)
MAMDLGGAKGGVKSDINVTPLVDVMLVLLIIMMLVAPLLQQGITVTLPKASNSVDKPETRGQTTIAISVDKHVYLNVCLFKLGVPLVSLLAGGFSEAGAVGARREARLREIVKGSVTRILGPNSLGVVRPATGLVLSANAAFAVGSVPSGQISVISQSGSAIGTFVSRGRARGIGFASLVSVGNEADLSVGTVGQTLVDDRQTEVFILFLESLKHAPDLEAFAEAAHRVGKSVLVYKLGRSRLGAQLAVSHTGAIVSDDDAANAYFRDLGFHRITVFEALFEGAPLFMQRHALPRASPKPSVAIVTTTGGGVGVGVGKQLSQFHHI